MESFVRATTTFWGSHTLKNHWDCGRDCGHTWSVEVLIAGEEDQDRWQMPVDDRKLEQEMFSISNELRGKKIDKMINPSVSSEMGICHWFYERLALRYDVREVICWHDEPNIQAILRAP